MTQSVRNREQKGKIEIRRSKSPLRDRSNEAERTQTTQQKQLTTVNSIDNQTTSKNNRTM